MGLRALINVMRPAGDASRRRSALPDPAVPPGNRGEWGAAALTNVEITELVKRQLRTHTRPQQK